MTDNQKKYFYFPAWYACCRANGWRQKNCALVIDAGRLTEEGRKVLALANQRALAAGRAPIVDDMRHGAHIVALGRDKSSEHLTNADVDRVVTLFKLLQDPDDLDAVMKWQAYERGEDPGADRRVDWFIQHAAPDAYVRHISHDKFGTRDWEGLSVGQKQQLARTLNERRRAKNRPMQTRSAEGGTRNAAQQQPAGSNGQRTYQMNPQLTFTKGPF